MNYEEMSDFEINVKVHILNGGLDNSDPTPNYCKNPSDAWPIILANKISLSPDIYIDEDTGRAVVTDDWEAESQIKPYISHMTNNPLRAAMIVFLRMQDSKHE